MKVRCTLSAALTRGAAAGIRALRRLAANGSGGGAAEFALVVPVLLLMIFGVIEFGRLIWYRNALQSAVEEATRCYALNRPSCNSTSSTQAFAASVAGGANFDPTIFTLSTPACGKRVAASYAFTSVVPLVPLTVTLQASACRPTPP